MKKRYVFGCSVLTRSRLAAIGEGSCTAGLRRLSGYYRQCGEPPVSKSLDTGRLTSALLDASDIATVKQTGVGALLTWWDNQGRPQLVERVVLEVIPTAPASEDTMCVAT